MTSINQEIEVLDEFAGKWANGEITDAYNQGIDKVLETYRAANINVSDIAANNRVMKTLINNTVGSLQDANQFIGRSIEDNIRQAGLEAVASGVGGGVKEIKNVLLEKLKDNGIPAIKDKNGRLIKADAYASMVARTTTREAANKASMQAVQDAGYDLVKIPSHFSTCEICAVYEGRVYSISGNTAGYPKLDDVFSGGHSTIHPNCTHSAVPYIIKFDDNPAQTKAESNRPFELTASDKRSVDNYNKEQAVKARRRSDRAEWEKEKAKDPQSVPKTFSAYRAKKRAGTLGVAPKVVAKPKAVVVKFVPAKTIDEAFKAMDKYAVNITVNKNIFKNLDDINKINETLFNLTRKYPIDVLQSIETGRTKAYASANRQMIKFGEAFINKPSIASYASNVEFPKKVNEAVDNTKLWLEKAKTKAYYSEQARQSDIKYYEKVLKKYEEMAKFSRGNVIRTGHEIEDVITHEYGHVLADQKFKMINGAYARTADDNAKIMDVMVTNSKARRDGDIYNISSYAKTDDHEFLSEVFAMRETGQALPAYITNMLERVFGK
jgi:hypothetical protein